MNSSRNQLPGCFWVLLFLLLVAPQFVGYVFFAFFIFALVFIVLAVVGGTFFLRSLNLKDYLKEQTESHNRFVEYLVKFMIKIGSVDGKLDESEIHAIQNFFQTHMRYGPPQMMWINRLIKQSIESDETIQELCDEFNTYFGLYEKKILIQLLYHVALADGHFDVKEQKLIDQIVYELDFPPFEHQTIKNIFLREGYKEDPLKVLGLSEDASGAEIKRRYRDLSKENHPDKVAHLGEEFQKVAQEKMTKINQAYEQLKKQGKVN